MEFKKYHRKYPDRKWDYRAISTRIDGKEIIYYTLSDNGKKSSGLEIYQGSNYDPSSSSRSYSKNYEINKIPFQYRKISSILKSRHKSTTWSNESNIN